MKYPIVLIAVVPALLKGCAIHYHDRSTGADHIWGFGHLSMKATATPEGEQAVVKGIETLGMAAGLGQEESYFQLGWGRHQRLELLQPDVLLKLDGPTADFLELKVNGRPESASTSK